MVLAFALAPGSSGADGTSSCVVRARPLLCREFAVFNSPAQPADRLPAVVRPSGPISHVVRSSARLLSDRPKGRLLYIVGGRKLLCLINYNRKRNEAFYVCSPPKKVIRGQMYLQESCGSGHRRHRLLLAQLVPDGPRRAVVRRVGKPKVVIAIHRNLMLADLPVRSHAQLPKSVSWHRRGRLRVLKLPIGDEPVTCRAPSPSARVLR